MSMSAGIAGSRRRWDLDLTDGDLDTNLATALSSAPTTRPLYVEVAAGDAVGGNASQAIIAGSLSGFSSVEVSLRGEAQGYGGAANTAGGDAIDANNQANLTITVHATGAIRGGGGGGGDGGAGATGRDTSGDTYRSFATDPDYWWVNDSTGATKCEWNDLDVTGSHASGLYGETGSYGYWRGAFEVSIYYDINRGLIQTGAKGTGGAGGVGQGYGQSVAVGVSGATGTNRAGTGGTSGAGAVWATAGSAGSSGGNGQNMTASGGHDVTTTDGASGTAGGAAGSAVINVTNVTITNNGTIEGTYV